MFESDIFLYPKAAYHLQQQQAPQYNANYNAGYHYGLPPQTQYITVIKYNEIYVYKSKKVN